MRDALLLLAIAHFIAAAFSSERRDAYAICGSVFLTGYLLA